MLHYNPWLTESASLSDFRVAETAAQPHTTSVQVIYDWSIYQCHPLVCRRRNRCRLYPRNIAAYMPLFVECPARLEREALSSFHKFTSRYVPNHEIASRCYVSKLIFLCNQLSSQLPVVNLLLFIPTLLVVYLLQLGCFFTLHYVPNHKITSRSCLKAHLPL